MRILALSLLRLGDVIMHRHLLRSLHAKYGPCEIDLTLNDSVLRSQPRLPEAQKLIAFPRESLQLLLGVNERPILRAIAELEEWIQQVSVQNYDLVVNLAPTKVSSRLMDCFSAASSLSPHLRASDEGHLIESTARALRLPVPARKPARMRDVRKIGFQTLTSQASKNWPLENWRKLYDQVSEAFPQVALSVFAAPGEVETLSPFFNAKDLWVCSWQELENTIDTFDWIVSGDTSVVHLAAEQHVPVLGLYLRDAQSSSPYQIGGEVLVDFSVEQVFLKIQNFIHHHKGGPDAHRD